MSLQVGGLGAGQPFDWRAWDGLNRYPDGRGLDEAPVAESIRMINAVVRADRFGEGTLLASLEDGTSMAAVDRLRRWFEERGLSGSWRGRGGSSRVLQARALPRPHRPRHWLFRDGGRCRIDGEGLRPPGVRGSRLRDRNGPRARGRSPRACRWRPAAGWCRPRVQRHGGGRVQSVYEGATPHRFAAMVWPGWMQQGANSLELCLVEEGDGPVLRRVAKAPG